jgi:hypothetical protein
MSILSLDAKEILLEKVKDFCLPEEEIAKRKKMRDELVSSFSNERMKKLKPEDYFPGLSKEVDRTCLGYKLEWETRSLGSIKGGSVAKFGAQEEFKKIKGLFIDLTSFTDKLSGFYTEEGHLTKASQNLIAQSLKIPGMRSGRTVLGKLLSIYYPNTFMPLFNDQDFMLNQLVMNYNNELIGLESYIKNNHLFLQIKNELFKEPAFLSYFNTNTFTNDHFYIFLYFCFPKPGAKDSPLSLSLTSSLLPKEVEKISALETEHYQKLIHRNFPKLFKGLKYYEEETQNQHEGRYSTEDAGVMDMLCINEKGDFVVIELKRRATDDTVGQLCRYMGWVKENLAKPNQKIHGLIISETKDIKLEYAVKIIPNVCTKQMKLDVTIKDF